MRTVALRVGGAAVLAALAAGLWYYETPATAPVPEVAVVTPPPRPAPKVVEAGPAPAPEPKDMSAAQRAAFDLWLVQAYRKCWSAPKSQPEGEPYLAKVRVAFKADGGLAGAPKLVNPPSDPAWRPHAEAALRAVKGCDPLHVPDKYAAYYPAWKNRTVYFDPAQP